ncbi:MAG: glycoside hydrolase 43 family protein [Comamonadaceae bacterium PBBC2]|nr:MAG: glycoside hydrolase 43 family protein [Comamonadaceae bacterium PBBC2]
MQKIAFEVVRIAKPLETRIQLRFALLCCEIYRTLVTQITEPLKDFALTQDLTRRDCLVGLLTGLALPAATAATATPAAATAPGAAAGFRQFKYRGLDFTAPLREGYFHNPILPGFNPDPTICRVGDDYYLVTSSFAYFPGLPIYHSRDLVHWTLLTHAIDRPDQLRYAGLRATRGLFAPALSHHAGTYYLLCTMVDAGGNFLLTATHPAGPWSDPVWLPFEGIDPSLFIDQDGSAWIINNDAPAGPPRYEGHRAIWLQRFDLATQRLVGARRVLVDGGADPARNPIWIEGPHLFRRGDWLYLCSAEGGTWLDHAQVIFRSRSLAEPFEPWRAGNPILTQRGLDPRAPGAVTCTGHAQLVVGPDGAWWAIFLGCRPNAAGYWLTGRETFLLPVQWTADGWPRILPADARVPLTLPAPRPTATAPMAGDRSTTAPALSHTFTQHFAPGTALAPDWVSLRGPHAASLGTAGLSLPLRPDSLSQPQQQAAQLLRRAQHQAFDVHVVLSAPAKGAAGLVLFQSEGQHLWLARDAQGVFLEQVHQGKARQLYRQEVAAGAGELLSLRCDGTRLHFFVDGQALPVTVDARDVSVDAAGGGNHFTGAMVGLHARLP